MVALQTAAQKELCQIVSRIENLNDDRAAISGDIKEVYDEAKGKGFDVKTIRKIIALRKLSKTDRVEQEELLDVYAAAVGWNETPLGNHAHRQPDEERVSA